MAMHDSFTPLGGMIPLINMMLGEMVFGGVGAGLYGIVVFIILDGVHRRADGGAGRQNIWGRRSKHTT